jgi:hypothetical protein
MASNALLLLLVIRGDKRREKRPAKAGIHFALGFQGMDHGKSKWIPACAGMTEYVVD